jgi:hypothetical protein
MVTIEKLSRTTPAIAAALWVKLAGNCATRHVLPLILQAFTNGGQYHGAFDDGRLVGLRVATVQSKTELFVHVIGVLDEFKGRGLAKQLSLAGATDAVKRGFKMIHGKADLLNADLVGLLLGGRGFTARGFIDGNPHQCLVSWRVPPPGEPGDFGGLGFGIAPLDGIGRNDPPSPGPAIVAGGELATLETAVPPATPETAVVDVAGGGAMTELAGGGLVIARGGRASVTVDLARPATYAELKALLDPFFKAGLAVVGFEATRRAYSYSLGVVDA